MKSFSDDFALMINAVYIYIYIYIYVCVYMVTSHVITSRNFD